MRAYRIVERVEVLTPRTLEEALRLKAERPEARPVAGGTDLLVELNFDRTRPETILNLAEVPELKAWSREDGSVRLKPADPNAEEVCLPLDDVSDAKLVLTDALLHEAACQRAQTQTDEAAAAADTE